jgi:hypothetical protein
VFVELLSVLHLLLLVACPRWRAVRRAIALVPSAGVGGSGVRNGSRQLSARERERLLRG